MNVGHLSQYELQKVLYAAFTANSTLMGLVTGIFDPAPENQAFPYVSFGDHYELTLPGLGKLNKRVVFYIDIWSQAFGFGEIAAIAEVINQIVEGHVWMLQDFQTVFMQLEHTVKLTDPDGITRHCELRYLTFNVAN